MIDSVESYHIEYGHMLYTLECVFTFIIPYNREVTGNKESSKEMVQGM